MGVIVGFRLEVAGHKQTKWSWNVVQVELGGVDESQKYILR